MGEEQPQTQAEQSTTTIANTLFPPPPAYYKAFTSANLARYAQLGGPSGTSKSRGNPDSIEEDQPVVERDDEEEKEFGRLKMLLSPPRSDWVEEEGRWKCFGETLNIHAHIPTLSEIGLPPWVDPSEPPQKSLPPLLHSFLHTLLLLLDALTNTALTPIELYQRGIHHVGDPYIQHLSNLAATMMVSANQLRGVQAEATLVLLMEKQLETKRAQTEALRRQVCSFSNAIFQFSSCRKCRSIASSVEKLREATRSLEEGRNEAMDIDSRSDMGAASSK